MSRNDERITFNITYYPVFKNIRRSVLPKVDVAGNSGPCSRKRPPCELCKLMKKLQLIKSEILMKLITYSKPLIAIPKTWYILLKVRRVI